MGTEGNDVIVATGPDMNMLTPWAATTWSAWSVGASRTGAGDDSVRVHRAGRRSTVARLVGGTDTYVGGAGDSDVIVDEISSFHVTMGARLRGHDAAADLDPWHRHRRFR